MAKNTYARLKNEANKFLMGKILFYSASQNNIDRFGQACPMIPDNEGDTAQWLKVHPLAPATQPLQEAVTKAGKKITTSTVTARVEEYGDVVDLTERLLKRHRQIKRSTYSKKRTGVFGRTIANQIIKTIELIRWQAISTGSNVFYSISDASNPSRANVNAGPQPDDFDEIERLLDRAGAMRHTDILPSTANADSVSIEACFVAFCHTDLKTPLKKMEDWIPVHRYGDHKKALPNEIGTYGSFRFIASRDYSPELASGKAIAGFLSNERPGDGSSKIDVYKIVIAAKDAYGVTPFNHEKSVKTIIKEPGEKNAANGNEFGKKGFISWLTYQMTVILEESYLFRYEVGKPTS